MIEPINGDLGSNGKVDIRNGETIGSLAGDHGIDPDHRCLVIKQRAAGVAPVDTGIGLKQVFSGNTAVIFPTGADNTRG